MIPAAFILGATALVLLSLAVLSEGLWLVLVIPVVRVWRRGR